MPGVERVSLAYIKYFIEACQCSSIQSASKKLFISAQGLGQGIQRLENSLGLRLLDRSASGVKATAFGKLFYEQSCIVDEELRKLEELADEYRHRKKNTIMVGTIGRNKFSDGIVMCINEYRRRYQNSTLETEVVLVSSSSELCDAVRDGELDIGWMYHLADHDDFKYYRISDHSRLVLLISADNPLAKRTSVGWEHLSELQFVTAGESDPFSDVFRYLCKQQGFYPNLLETPERVAKTCSGVFYAV